MQLSTNRSVNDSSGGHWRADARTAAQPLSLKGEGFAKRPPRSAETVTDH
jgi:hypothetical protein